MNVIVKNAVGPLVLLAVSGQAFAWAHANYYGGSTSHSYDSTSHTNAYGGSATHTYGQGTSGTTAYGTSYSHAAGSGQTTLTYTDGAASGQRFYKVKVVVP